MHFLKFEYSQERIMYIAESLKAISNKIHVKLSFYQNIIEKIKIKK